MTSGEGPARLPWRIAAVLLLSFYAALLFIPCSDIAGGSDSSGYLNAARLFSRARVSEKIEAFGMLNLPASDREAFIPLGLRPGAETGTLAPRYPPGLPLHMAAAAAIGGWGEAPFLVAPFSALAVLFLFYAISREFGLRRGLATAGVAILAACPIFYGMAIQPMSDVPATAWACAAILLALRARSKPNQAMAAGAALAMAALVRPTTGLLALAVLFALSFWRAAGQFLLGMLPFAGLSALYNALAFGRATETGYGSMLGWTMSAGNVLPNIRHYGYWIPALLTPLVPLAWLALPLDRGVSGRDRGLLLAWFGALFAFYLFYEPFEDWWSARFLLPGIPALILAYLLVARDVARRLPWRPRRTAAAGLALLAAALALDALSIRRFELFSMREGERIYRDASRWAASAAPPSSIFVSMQMSGALKYYTNRPIGMSFVPTRFLASARPRRSGAFPGMRFCATSRRGNSPGTLPAGGPASGR